MTARALADCIPSFVLMYYVAGLLVAFFAFVGSEMGNARLSQLRPSLVVTILASCWLWWMFLLAALFGCAIAKLRRDRYPLANILSATQVESRGDAL